MSVSTETGHLAAFFTSPHAQCAVHLVGNFSYGQHGHLHPLVPPSVRALH